MTGSMRGANGFSLIDALIALLLTSLVGLAFLRMTGVSMLRTQEARARAFAIHQMQGLAASISANRGYWVAESRTVSLDIGSAAGAPDCEAYRCAPAQLARFDMARWSRGLSTRLTGAAATASCAPDAGVHVCTIDLSWRERGTPATAAPSRLSLRFVP
ncbi:hypothetical protein [Cupriavidus plantarum]|uniref:hypothetical protein n=1 Tax=Cupriavidus plantarum TaxID=942865 RepID=UPI000E393352|nr:hypothetical protein [Cupriavidus plantarum]REE93850.1 Tfp pilus assembly protein PilV [Cupriavidus plantarum]